MENVQKETRGEGGGGGGGGGESVERKVRGQCWYVPRRGLTFCFTFHNAENTLS